MAWPVRVVQPRLPRRPASNPRWLGAENGLDVGCALIYDVPGRPAVSMTATTALRIAEQVSDLAGIKHAVHELDLVSELLLRLKPDFRVFCGQKSLSLPMLAIGAAGLKNAVGNLVPALVAALCNHAANGRREEARKPPFDLFELNQAIFLETNPIPLKSMMAPIGLLETSEVRLPLVPVDNERQSVLEGVLRRAGLLGIDRIEAVAGRTGHG